MERGELIYIERGGEVEISGIADFDLAKIFECGQCFRWDADENGVYSGVAHGRAARIRQVDESLYITGTLDDFEAVWFDYFDLRRDYAAIRRSLCVDDFMREAVDFGAGLRILRQDSWEALCSFIISQCNNIPRIKKIIASLCRCFGDRFDFDGEVFYSFPSAEKLAALEPADLAPLRCGYRSDYIIGAARAVASGKIVLAALAEGTLGDARVALKKLHGVGDKVADCVLLFGLNMLDAFPVDVWVRRAVASYYGDGFDSAVFSPYAGIAQQYMFYYMRPRTARGNHHGPAGHPSPEGN